MLLIMCVASISLFAQGIREYDIQGNPMTETGVDKGLKKFDYSTWKLQLPTANEDKTSVAEIKRDELSSGYQSEYFYYNNDGSITFYAPVDGFKTANTTYCRSELRELIDGEHSYNNWTLHGTHILNVSEKVTETSSNGRTVVSQIHGINPDGSNGPVLVKVEYDGANKQVCVLLKTGTYDNAADERHYLKDIEIGERFDTTIKVVEGRVFVTVKSGDKKLETSKNFYEDDPTWDNYNFYYKVGNYVQDSVLDYEGESATVILYSMNTAHEQKIENIEPKDVSIGDSLSMEVGADTKLSVEFVPFDTTNTDCTWSIESGDDCVALSQNGELTAVSLGNAVIKATSKENPSLSAICRVAVKEKKAVEAKLVYSEDFSNNLGDEWTIAGAGNANVVLENGELTFHDSDIGKPAKATLNIEPLGDTVTVSFKVKLFDMDVKDKGTSKEQASYYYFDVNSESKDNLFRIRNKADLNAGQLLDPRIVLSRGYLTPTMNEEASHTPLGTSHTITMVIRCDNNTSKANTTDTYIDGVKIGSKLKNNSEQKTLSMIDIFSGTKDLLNFSIDDLKIYSGEMLPEGLSQASMEVGATPSVLKVGKTFRVKADEGATFKVVEGSDAVAVSDSGLITGIKSGTAKIEMGNRTVELKIVDSVTEVSSISLSKSSITIDEDERVDLSKLIEILPSDATEKGYSISIIDGERYVELENNKIVHALNTGTSKLMISSLSDPSVVSYLTVAVVNGKEVGTVMFEDSFGEKEFDVDSWTIKTANHTSVELRDGAFELVDDSMAGQPKAYVTFEPIDNTFTISYKFMLLNDEVVSGSKMSCYTFAVGADSIGSTKNEAFRFKTNASYNEAKSEVENRHFIYSKELGVSGFYDIDAPIELNRWYDIMLVTTPDDGSDLANTTDVYIDGMKVVDKASNKRIIPVYDKIIFETGTKDRTAFLIDDLNIKIGDCTQK